MSKAYLTQAEIIEALTGANEKRRSTALICLFGDEKLRKIALTHVRRYGGNRQDGEDVFQEAIIVFDRKLRLGAYMNQGSLEAYFMGIVRWHWFNEQQRRGKAPLIQADENTLDPELQSDPELEYLLTERRDLLEKLLAQLSEKCRGILKMYQLEYPMEEIARLMGFSNRGVAKKEAFLCRKRFRAVLEKRPDIWNDVVK
jgi:RNA polymerase sigma factor (sigma-70 family)